VTTIPRHTTDVDEAGRVIMTLSPRVGPRLDRVPEEPHHQLARIRDTSLALAEYRCVVDPTAAERETWEDLQLAAQAAAAVFVGEPGEDVEVTVGRKLRYTAPGPGAETHPGAWLTAVWLNVILRDEQRIRQLCAVPADTLRASGVEHDAYMYPWIESVRAFLRHEGVTPDTFIPAMDGTDPDQARYTGRGPMLQLVYPPIKMFYYMFRRDVDKFNAALADALTDHRTYWAAPGGADESDGFLALKPMGVAVLALGAGMPVTVSSEYLPENLLRGRRPAASSCAASPLGDCSPRSRSRDPIESGQ
jgi:Immunity protein 49